MTTVRYEFGEVELDPASYGLSLRGAPVQVEPRVLELLIYLIKHRDRMVTKEELLEQVWPRKYVTESVLTRAISEARRAIDDDSRRQVVIKTIHSRGYQFIAPVQEVVTADTEPAEQSDATPNEAPASDTPAVDAAAIGDPAFNGTETTDSAETESPARRRWWLLLLAPIALLIAAALWLWWPTAPDTPERIAVVPFTIDANAQDLEWGELALPRLLADVLTERSNVVVFPANRVRQSLQQKGVDADASEQEQLLALRDIFGADHVLFGRVGRENGRMLVEYDLVAVDGTQRTGRAVGDGPGNLTTGLAESVARELNVAYAAGIPARKISANEFSNEAFARGLNAQLGGELADALRYFETCLASEPDNGWARYEAGNVLLLLGHWDDAQEAFTRAGSNAEANGDHNLGGVAATGLGTLAWRRGRLDEAEDYFEMAQTKFTATNRRANLASAYGNLGILADNRGDLALARERYETALTLYRGEGERAGESAAYSNLAVIERKQGRLEAAAQLQRRAIDLQRQVGLREMLVFSLSHLGEIERDLGRWNTALPLLDEAVTLAHGTRYRLGRADALAARGALAMDFGQRDSAESDLREALAIYAELETPAGEARTSLRLATLLRTSDTKQARELVERAVTLAEQLSDEELALEAELNLIELGAGDHARVLPRLQVLGNHRLLAMSWAIRARREDNPAHFRTALAHAERAGNRRQQAELALELGRMLLLRGETENIEALLGRAETWKADYPPTLMLRACYLAHAGRSADAQRVLGKAGAVPVSSVEADMSWCPDWPK